MSAPSSSHAPGSGILVHLYRSGQNMLASFFGNAEILLERNIEDLDAKNNLRFSHARAGLIMVARYK